MKRLSVLMAVAFVDMMGLMIIWPLLPLYAKNLGASATVVGLLAASFPIAQLVSSPVWGYVSDRYGRRPALLVGLGTSAIAYVVFGFAHTVWLLFISRFVQGLGGGTTGVVQAYVADTMLPRERAKALGWLSAATSAGVIMGPPLGSFMHHFGEAAPGVFASVLVLINVGFAWKWLPESRWAQAGVTRAVTEAPRPPTTLADAVRNIVQPAVRVIADPGRPVSLLIWIYAFGMLAFNALPPVFSPMASGARDAAARARKCGLPSWRTSRSTAAASGGGSVRPAVASANGVPVSNNTRKAACNIGFSFIPPAWTRRAARRTVPGEFSACESSGASRRDRRDPGCAADLPRRRGDPGANLCGRILSDAGAARPVFHLGRNHRLRLVSDPTNPRRCTHTGGGADITH